MVSAYGTRADWYRDPRVQPALRVRTGFLDYLPRQRVLTAEERRAEESASWAIAASRLA